MGVVFKNFILSFYIPLTAKQATVPVQNISAVSVGVIIFIFWATCATFLQKQTSVNLTAMKGEPPHVVLMLLVECMVYNSLSESC